ncbi:MAG: DUF4339 domain-containing protein [Elusimicrobiales bacterium]
MRYFYADANNQPIGPYTLEELKQLNLNGTVRPETWVVEEGGSQWQPYTNLLAAGAAPGGAELPKTGAPENAEALVTWKAVVAFLCCMPIGFMQWGQTVKGWLWLVITIVVSYSGVPAFIVGLPSVVDYWMNFAVQRKRKVGEWEFFPTK